MVESMIVDRFEGDMAVCEVEVGVFVDVPRTELPPAVREGGVVVARNGAWELDEDASEARRKRILQKAAALFNR